MFARKLGAQSPVQLDKVSVPPADMEVFLAVAADSNEEFLVSVLSASGQHSFAT